MSLEKMKIKKGDMVQIVAGKSRGARGEVLSVDREATKIIVKGVNIVTRHKRPDATNPEGKKVEEKPLHVSNVALIDPESNIPSRVGYRFVDGKKIRYAKKSGKEL